VASQSHADFALMDHVEARAGLHAAARASLKTLRFSLLEPVQPALGRGKIRVLRVHDDGAGYLDVIAGYESYERID